MIQADNMILLGAAARNTGKTVLAVRLIEQYSRQQSVVAIKVITIHNHGDVCPRGGKGCGICSGLKTCFDITKERADGVKDTMLFKKAGARAVYLVRAYPESLGDAMKAVLALTEETDQIICESNSVRTVVNPGEFVMLRGDTKEMKASARAVIGRADRILNHYLEYFDGQLIKNSQ